MSKIELNDSLQSMVMKMSEGNPGAVNVIVQLIKNGASIDPDSWAGDLSAILHLDTLEIYGSRIWMLYKDVCHESVLHTIALLRANQLGLLDRVTLFDAIDNYGRGLDCNLLIEQVQAIIPKFGSNWPRSSDNV